MQFSFLSFILAFFLPILDNQFGVHHLRVHVPFKPDVSPRGFVQVEFFLTF